MLTLKNQMESYSHDEMAEDIAIRHYPDMVVKPRTSSEISQILKLANTYRIPVTPRGAGTGLSGGAVPIFGGILLSLE